MMMLPVLYHVVLYVLPGFPERIFLVLNDMARWLQQNEFITCESRNAGVHQFHTRLPDTAMLTIY